MENKSLFEEIKHTNEIGQEYWSAREFYTVLEYIKWDKFINVIDKAIVACKNSGGEEQDHFPQVEKMVEIGSGALREHCFQKDENIRYVVNVIFLVIGVYLGIKGLSE